MTYVVTEACIKCKYTDCVSLFRSTASTKARICWSFTRTNASIAASANPNARQNADQASTLNLISNSGWN